MSIKVNKHDLQIRTLLSAEVIAKRIGEIAAQIDADFTGDEITVVTVMKGSFIFAADLVRAINTPLTCYFVSAASYGDAKVSSGEVVIDDSGLPKDLAGRHILLIEDIVDSGLTMIRLKEHLLQSDPASVRVCSLLRKPEAIEHHVEIDYVGFEIGNEFVVGYGLDYAQYLRELPYIGVLEGRLDE